MHSQVLQIYVFLKKKCYGHFAIAKSGNLKKIN